MRNEYGFLPLGFGGGIPDNLLIFRYLSIIDTLYIIMYFMFTK